MTREQYNEIKEEMSANDFIDLITMGMEDIQRIIMTNAIPIEDNDITFQICGNDIIDRYRRG